MTDIRTITHDNVIKLRDAMVAERARVDELTQRISALELLTRTLLVRMEETNQKATLAFAVAQQGRV